jgi:hypothetical protein
MKMWKLLRLGLHACNEYVPENCRKSYMIFWGSKIRVKLLLFSGDIHA